MGFPGVCLRKYCKFGAPAESFKRGAWGFLGSVDESIASLARLQNRSKEGHGVFLESVDGGIARMASANLVE